jgi:hypothetical protein
MFFVLSGALERFHMLKHGLAVVLIFVGLKMIWLDHLFGGRFPIGASLAIIGLVIAASIALSLLFPKSAGPKPQPSFTPRKKTPHTVLRGVVLILATASILYATSPGGLALDLDRAGSIGGIAEIPSVSPRVA